MPFQGGSKFNGPLKYKAHTQQAVGGPGAGQKAAYLDACGLEAVDGLIILPYGTDDDKPRTYGYTWQGALFPGPLATATTTLGITSLLTASSTLGTGPGAPLQMVTSAGAPALNTYVSTAIYQVLAGKHIWYSIRLSLQTVASEAVIVGLVNSFGGADLTTLPTEGIFFLKVLAGTDFSGIVRHSSTSTTVSTLMAAVGDAPLTDTTQVDLGILVDNGGSDSGLLTTGIGPISFYVNGKFAGAVSGTDANVPTGNLSWAIATNTTGGAKTMKVIQFLCVEEF